MKFGTLQTASGDVTPVGIHEVGSELRFVDLCAVDDSLPHCLRGILQIPGELDRAGRALETGVSQERWVTGKLLAPIRKPGKILCIGLNYSDHAKETGAQAPAEPIVFGKFGNTIIGPEQAIVLPACSSKVDYEAELVVVIGKPAKDVSVEEALDYVAGYMVGHDVSARDWQKGRPGGQWLLGKSPDTFAPIGPYLVTPEEVGDPHQLKISLTLNGETLQDGTTADLIFNIPQLIAHVSQLMTLEPGDLIFTGTPAGVGDARTPPVYLKPGDEVAVTIEKLGTLTNPVLGSK